MVINVETDRTSERIVEIPEKELESLRREAILRDLAETLEERIKRRVGILLVIVAVLSFFGIQGLATLYIHQQLNPQIDKAKDATARINAEADLVSRRSIELLKAAETAKKDARSALELAEAQSAELRGLMEKLGEKATSLDSRFRSVSESSKKIEGLINEQMLKLKEDFKNMSVQKLLDANDKSLDQYVTLATEGRELGRLLEEIETLEKALAKKQDSIDKLPEAERNEKSGEIFEDMIRLMVLVEQFNERVDKYNTKLQRLRDEDKKPNKANSADAKSRAAD